MNKNSKCRQLIDEIQGHRAEICVTGLYKVMLETPSDVEKDLAPQWESVESEVCGGGCEMPSDWVSMRISGDSLIIEYDAYSVDSSFSESIKINFCMMCGKKLPTAPEVV